MKLCIDCKWHRTTCGYSHVCEHPACVMDPVFDRVDGTVVNLSFCQIERSFGIACGHDGKLFEPKPAQDPLAKQPYESPRDGDGWAVYKPRSLWKDLLEWWGKKRDQRR